MIDNYIFALDIGTRSVVGVVLQETSNGLEIIACDHLEHQTRAMIDGQIHDIEQVSKALKIVKEKLENKIGFNLKQVAVAAAGRALKTVRIKATSDIAEFTEINKEDILRLELQAVQEAQKQLADNETSDEERLLNYHCVGYSVVNYELDGFKIGSLFSQRGKSMAVEIIATFLPRVVVDSIFSAINKIDLEMSSLTLEPIAASTVVVPSSMRQLNIALVDIGAGTSDIAITSEGSIVGYGMAPVAGDEITEKISSHYLVDFNQAEEIKRSIAENEEIKFVDILGVEHKVPKQEMLTVISDAVKMLAKQISEKIIELNGRIPQAVICIGGGSLTPLLREMLSEELGLVQQRIAVRGREAISAVSGAQELMGPDSVTPIGIAVTAYEKKGLGFARITINGRQVRLFEINRSTVADALMAAGIDMRKTRPKLGMAMTIVVNGELKILKGERGKPAVIKLNGFTATLDTTVQNDDNIEFEEAQDGQDASGFVYDVVPSILPLHISVNDELYEINPVITMNEQVVSYTDQLVDNARIEYHMPKTLAEVLDIIGKWEDDAELHAYVNELPAELSAELSDGDEIIIHSFKNKDNQNIINLNENAVNESTLNKETTAVKAGEEIGSEGITEENGLEIVDNNSVVVYVNEEPVELSSINPILTDIFAKVNVSLRPPKAGMKFEMKVNGISAEFTTPLKNGDIIILDWIEG